MLMYEKRNFNGRELLILIGETTIFTFLLLRCICNTAIAGTSDKV
jgi:hypothetical protein